MGDKYGQMPTEPKPEIMPQPMPYEHGTCGTGYGTGYGMGCGTGYGHEHYGMPHMGYPQHGMTPYGAFPGCGCTPASYQKCCNVVDTYQVKEVPHIKEYHTHYVNHMINKHVTIPKYTSSYETKCHDKFC